MIRHWVDAMDDPLPAVRALSAWYVPGKVRADVAETLTRLLEDENAAVRLAASRSLAGAKETAGYDRFNRQPCYPTSRHPVPDRPSADGMDRASSTCLGRFERGRHGNHRDFLG